MTIIAQEAGVQPGDPAFVAKYAGLDFKGKFALAIEQTPSNNYFLVDFSILPVRFERVYFINLTFSSDKLINIDPDISKDRVCFMANSKYSETDILEIFEDLKKKVDEKSASWSENMKAEWLQRNDKYK